MRTRLMSTRAHDRARRWSRAWAAEETRHAQALGTWLYLSGRVDSRALHASVQRLIGAGVGCGGGSGSSGGGAAADPYQTYIAWALQVRGVARGLGLGAWAAGRGVCGSARRRGPSGPRCSTRPRRRACRPPLPYQWHTRARARAPRVA